MSDANKIDTSPEFGDLPISETSRMRTMREGLTLLQLRFANAVLSGKYETMARAYSEVYGRPVDTSHQRKLVSNDASRVWNSAKVRAYVDACKESIEANNYRRVVSSKHAIRARLWEEARSRTNKGSERIAALKLLGEEARMFGRDRNEEEDDTDKMNQAELIEEIERTLSHYSFDSSSAVDIVPLIDSGPSVSVEMDGRHTARAKDAELPRIAPVPEIQREDPPPRVEPTDTEGEWEMMSVSRKHPGAASGNRMGGHGMDVVRAEDAELVVSRSECTGTEEEGEMILPRLVRQPFE